MHEDDPTLTALDNEHGAEDHDLEEHAVDDHEFDEMPEHDLSGFGARKRRRLTPFAGVLAAVLVAAAGFYAGIRVEKAHGSTTSASSRTVGTAAFAGAAGRFAGGGAGFGGAAAGGGGAAAGGGGAGRRRRRRCR